MAKRPTGDPFDLTDNQPIGVPAGIFSQTGGSGPERTGSTNARLVGKAGPFRRFKATPVAHRVGWISAAVLVVLMVAVVPGAIATFAGVRHQQLEAAANELPAPELIIINDECSVVLADLDRFEVSLILSGGIAETGSRDEFSRLIESTKAAALENRTDDAQRTFEEVRTHFIARYSQNLATNAEDLMLEYSASDYETDERVEELIDIVRANSGGQNMDALHAAVNELPQRVGDAKDEHFANRVTWVPPKPAPTTTPTGTIAPAPAPTNPSITNKPAPPNDNGGNGGNPDPTWTQGPGGPSGPSGPGWPGGPGWPSWPGDGDNG